MVDRETAAAIEKSPFLRSFANLEVRTTTGTRATWTGRYLYGKQTYIELFGPGDLSLGDSPAPIGTWGIAISADVPGGNAALKRALEAAGQKAFVEMETRKFGNRTVPWFEALTAVTPYGDSGDLAEDVTIWAMEYVPSYFEVAEAAKEPAEHPGDVVSRERYQPDAYANKLMRDVTFAHFDVGAADLARIEPLLRAAGYRIVRSGSDIQAIGRDSTFRFSLIAADGRALREVRFALNRPVSGRVETIGRSRLSVGPGAAAAWTFPPLQ